MQSFPRFDLENIGCVIVGGDSEHSPIRRKDEVAQFREEPPARAAEARNGPGGKGTPSLSVGEGTLGRSAARDAAATKSEIAVKNRAGRMNTYAPCPLSQEHGRKSFYSRVCVSALENLHMLEFRAEHVLAGDAEPLVEDGGVDLAEIGVVLQIAHFQLGQAGMSPTTPVLTLPPTRNIGAAEP